ncbi:MAG: baseplate J/gp47 family protein [Nitrosopumilus sp.]
MISFPNLNQIKQRTRSDLSQTTELDATIRRSFLRSIADAIASRSFDLNKTIQQLVGQLFPQTATGTFLRRWGDYQGLPPLAATGSTGTIVITGTVGTSLTDTANFIFQDEIFSLVGGVTISTNSPTITSLIRSGTNAIADTSGDHGLATGVTVTISGADQPEYNGSFVVLAITSTRFSYQVVGSPVTPATGTILATFDGVTGTVQSDGFGVVQNLDSGAQLDITIPVIGIDTAAFVKLDGLIGGTDLETDVNYSARIIEARSNVSTLFNVGQIIIESKKIKGVTRVFVKETTPVAGQVEVYFLRDNDNPISPDANEIQDVKDQLLLIKPSFMSDGNLFVLSPTLIDTDFTFLDIVPDSTSMRDSIAANLKAFFTDEVQFETTVTQEAYSAAIQNSIDGEGNSLQSFLLSAPTGDIVVTTSEIAAFGSVVHV